MTYDRYGFKVWRCLTCGDEVSEMRKALAPEVEPRVPVEVKEGDLYKVAEMVLSEELPLSDLDPRTRSAVEDRLLSYFMEGLRQ
jgi:hypothetical protein